MKVYHLHHCCFFVLFVMFFPNFSPKRQLPLKDSQTMLCNISIPFKFAHPSHRCDAKTDHSNLHRTVFTEASPRSPGTESISTRKPRKTKSPKRRSKSPARRSNRRRQRKRKKTKISQNFTPLSTQAAPPSIAEQRKKMEAIWNEINSYKRAEKEDMCGTRWTRSDNQHSSAKFQPHKTYGTLLDSPLQLDRSRRHVSDVMHDVDPSVVYFSGRSILKQNDLTFKSNLFTAELWVKPEGGQSNPAVILTAGRSISRNHFETEWTLGIGSANSESRQGFIFTKKSSGESLATIHSPYAYKPEEWAHLTVSCGGGLIRLYVNGVQVGVRHDPREELLRRGVKFDTLILGGNEKMAQGYRGMVDKLVVWSVARPQPDIGDDMYNLKVSRLSDDMVTADDFDKLANWLSLGTDAPMIWNEDTPERGHRVHFPEITTPPCGQTICDNPAIVRSYTENWTLRRPKTLRYNIMNVNEDDSSCPMFTLNDVTHQATLLRDAFAPHNITWISKLVQINDSRLRRKTIGCEAAKIGNRQCDMECNHARMGFDGGDCDLDFTICEESKRGNGHCDDDCNKIYHDWDMGDCCDPQYTDTEETCFNPTSQNRAYISVSEYKAGVGADNSRQLSVLFANWSNPNSIGVSTFPWDKEVFTSQGGTVVQLRPYASREEMSGLVHELGHNLGLLHVHHGAHNIDCNDICAELQASMTTGDLCEDTNPTPMNTNCDEPTLTEAMCSIHNFTRTPYSNFMSYADGSCQDNFTPQQRARMHCYIDLVYSDWSEGNSLAPIPLAPTVVSTSRSERSITISWAPPIDGRLIVPGRQCDSRCMPDKRLRQFASSARSPDAIENDWSASEATGPPDQATCTVRGIHFWMPAWSSTISFDGDTGFALDLVFENAAVPSLLRLWITYGTEKRDGIKSVELLHEDNTKTVLTGLHVSCDTPLSIHLQTKKLTRRIRVNVTYPFTAIDAVEMISEENDAVCSGCRRIKYKVHRDPPFPNNLVATTEQNKFTDKSCDEGITYSYSVQPALPPDHGELSPLVQFRLGQTFCGDAIVQNLDVTGPGEDCDDGNTEDEDGCSSGCRIEDGFHCKGEPSTCYWHEGDGLCEEFERIAASPDCANDAEEIVTQWAMEASSSSAAIEAFFAESDSHSCRSANEVLGPPDSQCSSVNGTWSPCSMGDLHGIAGEHWLKVAFETPVTPSSVSIYLGSITERRTNPREVFSLLLSGEEVISSGVVTLSCSENPIVIKVPETAAVKNIDHFIVKFSLQDVSIDAIALISGSSDGNIHDVRPAPTECVMEKHYESANVTCQITDALMAPGTAGTSWPHRTRCFIVCSRGYIPKSTQWITCRSGVWDTSTECVPISCGAPSHVKFASFSCENGHKLNGVCNFTCWENARMVGIDNTFVCDEDGVWSVPTSHCEPACSSPPIIGFSTAACNEFSNKTSFSPGETCKYRCKSGYHATQQPSNRRSFRLVCGDDGVWKGPVCQPVLCPPLPTIHRGQYTCTKGILFGSECTMSCPRSEKNETIRCDGNGRWSSVFRLCSDTVTSCEYPRAPPGVEIKCDGLNTGQTCKASCVLKEGLPPRDISALSDGLDTEPNPNLRFRLLVCTGERWFPIPDDLFCVEPCDPQLKRNGFCDARNNRAYCEWDGGDCCTRGRRRGPIATPCDRMIDGGEDKDIDWKAIKSPTPRSRNILLFGSLRAAHTARISMVDDGRRHKKRRRGRARQESLRASRAGRDDSRRKHKHRRRHSSESRKRRRHQRRSRG